MREIKFRAWNPETKTMEYPMIIGINGEDFSWAHDRSWLHNCQDWSGEEGYLYNPTLMQYTGLKDKYGKELYEGDLVSVGGSDPIEIKFGISRHVVHGHGECTETIVAGFELGYWGRENDFLYLGNIHETPQLLTKNI